MPYINKTWYELYEGENPVLIFIHGYSMNSSIWDNQINFFKKNKRLILDLRGHGKSLNEAPETLEDYCKDINQIMEREKIKKAILVGNSLGGAISLLFADLFPKKVKKIILINPQTKKGQFRLLPRFCLILLSLLPLFPNFYIKHKNSLFLKIKGLFSTRLKTLKKTKKLLKDYNFDIPKNIVVINSKRDEILKHDFKNAILINGKHVLQLSNPRELNKIISDLI